MIHRGTNDYGKQSDPAENPNFRRRWNEPAPAPKPAPKCKAIGTKSQIRAWRSFLAPDDQKIGGKR